jgi:hypothetical protein
MLRMVRFLIAYGVVSVLGVLVSLFLAQNTQVERLTFFGRDLSTSLAWIIAAATAAGFAFALLLLLPGRIAATLHIWSLRKEARQLDEELVWQSERHDELLEHHERLLSGHEWLLTVYRRANGELDSAVRERDALKVQLAKANEALVAAQKQTVRREIIIPAPVRQSSQSTPTAPRIPVVSAGTATATLDEREVAQIEQTSLSALPVAAPAPSAPASEPLSAPLQNIQQAQVAVMPDETASDETWLAPPTGLSRSIFSETLMPRVKRLTSSLDSWRREAWSSAQRLDTQTAQRVEQAITQARQFATTTWTHLRERLNGIGARKEDQKRVSPLTHPK